jgi:hypothetical protein
MSFKLNAFLPSKQQEVQIKELCYRQYRELVKSLHNTDKRETIQQYNSILEDLCPDIVGKDITFEDKLSLLLTVRNYCVSPDLKLKCTLPDQSIFNYTVPVETVLKAVNTINKSGTISHNNIIVEFTSYKVRDEYVFSGNNKDINVILASHIDTIKTNNNTVYFKDLLINERIQVVSALPFALTSLLQVKLLELNTLWENTELLTITNPVNNEVILKLTGNITFEVLQKMIEFLFTENLNNVYRSFYNMVKYGTFDANYIDSITPVELQVYWMYFMQDQEKSKNREKPSGGFNLPETTKNTELGF